MDSEANKDLDKAERSEAISAEGQSQPSGMSNSRRQFARGAAVGGVVLLSLGNRSAWGVMTSTDKVCFSKALLESFAMNGLASMAPGTERESEIQRFLSYEQMHPNAVASEEVVGSELKVCFTEPDIQ
ncbi:hypothetical protein H2508_06290 [Parahaliea sp. F7430]|uniref:Uncharacterized protein n=1 Tax=Sediminihaliea albiluteola TaxID=2758564 RepID=A0A7W2TVK3_9GAMM|nr:hypothetical protein [Sediminihaliea albiluteola]MBA6412720.1 hypothetical protein [Sediminihaliea albiluteola]